MKTEYSIKRAPEGIIISIKPIGEHITLSSSVLLTRDLANALHESLNNDWDAVCRQTVFALVREAEFKLATHLAETIDYIDDEDLKERLIKYCKRLNNNDIEIVDSEMFLKMKEEMMAFLNQ
jgi:hypothetical protein